MRDELIDEYRRASGEKSFHMVNLSGLLQLLGANAEAVKEVEKEQATVALQWLMARPSDPSAPMLSMQCRGIAET